MVKKYIIAAFWAFSAYNSISACAKASFKETCRGFVAGFGSALVVDFARARLSPDLTRFKLYDTYGVCRDQLTGQAKVAVAYIAASAGGQAQDTRSVVARVIGVLLGTHGAVVAKKFLNK